MIQEESNSSLGNSQTTEPSVTSPTQTEESNSLTQSLNALKSFNPKTLFQVDTYVDALDTYSTWRIAKILQIKDEIAQVNYDGWSNKWNESIKLGGSKIAPFKKVTPTYTGGNKTAIRDFSYEDSGKLVKQTIKQLETHIAEKLKVNDPNFIAQFFRGRLYILIDAILSLNQQIPKISPEQERKDPETCEKIADQTKIVKLMETYIEFFVEYLNVLPSLLKEYIDGKALNQPLLYMVNEKIALVSCIPELFETMTKLFGGNSRLKLFQNNEFEAKSFHSTQAVKPKDKYSGGLSNQIINNINHFGSNGGFEKLIALLKWEQKYNNESKKGDQNDKENIYRFPLNQVKWIFAVIAPITQYLASSFKDKFGQELRMAFFDRLDKLTNRDLKDNDNQILGLIRESLPIFDDFFGKDAFVLCEQAELEVTLSILKSPFLERKIKALNEFKDFFDRADPQVDLKQLGEKRRFKYLTNDKLKAWIVQKKILEYVLGEQSHVELLKRSITIMKFLAGVNALTQDNLDLLWKGCNSTHEDYVRAVYDTIIELSSEISVENIDYLFTKIKEIPMESYNEPIIDLITKFTLNGMKALQTSSPTSYFAKAIKRTPKYEFYGLKLLWESIQDGSPMKGEFTTSAFQSVTQIVKNSAFKAEKEKYLIACFENLKRGISVPQSLVLSLHILSTYNSQSGLFGTNSSLDEIITKLQKDYNLVQTVVNEFEKYMEKVAAVWKSLEDKGVTPTEKHSYVFVGRYSHIQNIDNRLLFLENIALSLRKGDFSIDHMKNLWNVLVKKSVTEVERNAFLKWVMKYKTSNNGKIKNYIFSDSLLKGFFNDILCDSKQTDYFKVFNPEIFACFEKIFEVLNEKEENIEIVKIGFKVQKFQNLIGYDVLWNIFLNCPNERVLRDVKNLIVNINLKVPIDEKIFVWQTFIEKWVESFNTSSKSSNPNLLVHVISLLNLFVVQLDGRKYLHRDGPVSETVNLVVADKRNEKKKKTITMPLNGTFFLLRKKISEEFGISVDGFDMYLLPNFKISTEIEEDYTITAVEANKDKDKDILISLRPGPSNTQTPKEKFRAILVSNQQIMDILFELLGAKNTKIINDIWELLSYLPFNKSLKNTFVKLPVENEKEWFKILDVTCPRKLLYCLKIVSDLAMGSKVTENDLWTLEFIRKKGFDHLFKIFFKIEDNELSSLFNCKSSATLISIIIFIIENYYSELIITPEKFGETLSKLLRGLSLVTQNGFIQDAEDPHLQEDLKKPAQEFVLVSFELLITCIKRNPDLVRSLYDFPDLSLLLRNGLIESDNPHLRSSFAQSFKELVNTLNTMNIAEGTPAANSFFLSFLLKDLLDYAFSHRDKCNEFFNVIEDIFKKCSEEEIEAAKINLLDLANELSQKIISLPPFETQQTDQDSLLQGLMSLLRLVFIKKPAIKDEILIKSQPELLHEILHNCLFEIPSAIVVKGVTTGPKCKSKESRNIAFQLLQSMSTGLNEITIRTVNYLKKLVLNNFWRTHNNSDWYIVPITSERSKVGYAGLENLGCTCYMNSLFQQLYMISDFSNTILESDDLNAGKIENHENLFHQVQLIFGALKLTQRQYYDPRLFCHAFKDYEGNPMNVLEQMDVDEFFNNIMDKLETVLKPTPNEGIIKRTFGGVMSNELICKGCPHYSEREEPCLAISLQVKNKKNITESLQAFIQGEMLEGENAYLCERCDKKVPTLKRVCIKKLPNILILVLKRFEFDYDTMQRFKVNDYCEFPEELNMLQYTQAYLKKSENQKDDQGSEASGANDVQDYPPEYYQYKLRGTVIHMGTAESGHYYSFIKDNTNNWFEFNDSIVRPFDLKDLAQEAFGGEEKLNIENIGNAKEVKERNRNAYLLFYEREAYFDENGNRVSTMLIGNQDREARNKVENMNPQILKETKEDNFKFHTTKYIWDRDYGDYVFRLLEEVSKNKNLANPSNDTFEAAKFCTLFFMTVILRGQERARLPKFLKELKVIFKASPKLCAWFLECFSFSEIMKEFLVDCPVKDMKYFVLGLIKISLYNVYQEQGALSLEEFEKGVLCKFINSLIFVMYEQSTQIKLLDKLFDILALFSGLGVVAKQYLAKKQIVGRLIYYMVPEKPSSDIYKDYTEEFVVTHDTEESEIGRPSLSSGVKANELVKSISEMISKKKEKMMMEMTTVNYNSLIETIANIAEEPSAQLVKDEKNLLYSNINVSKLLMMHSTSKRARKIASSLVSAISVKSENSGKELFLLLEKELRDKDDAQLKVYLQTLEKLMLVHDDHQKARVENGISILMNTIKDNSKYYRATEICLDYLFKLCSRNSWALRLCSENKAFLRFVESWLREYSNPYQGFSTGTLKLFKKKAYKILKEEFMQCQSKFISKSQERLAKLKKVHKNDSEELAPEYDSDEDFSDHQYQIQEKIDYLSESSNTWVSAIVTDNLDEMIKLQLQNDQTVWIVYDCDRTGPHLRVQSHTKNNVDFYST